jgi:pimeloyl-ACP methyl ester carboxylesterase
MMARAVRRRTDDAAFRRRTGGLAVLAVCLSAAVAAQAQEGSESVRKTMLSDPSSDAAYPAELQPVRIPSGGVEMYGLFYIAQGAGPHPTVLLLHGFPGIEWNADLAQFMRRAGHNVLAFRYRGAWGSPGDFSFGNALADAQAALAFLRSPALSKNYRVDQRRLVVVGHSFGGFVGLMLGAADSGLCAVAAIAPPNMGLRGRRLADPAVFAERAPKIEARRGGLHGASGEGLARELVAHAADWDLSRQAEALFTKQVLLVAAARDADISAREEHEPLLSDLSRRSSTRVTAVTLDSDHSFSDKRIALAETVVGWLLGKASEPCSPR